MPVIKVCIKCGVDYKKQPSEAEQSLYCSRKCKNETQIVNLTGRKFNNLTAVNRIGRRGGCLYWLFRCDCGKAKELAVSNVKKGLAYCCGRVHEIADAKKCSDCKVEKPLTEFHKNKSRNDGCNNFCKLCSSNRSKEWKKFNAEKVRKQKAIYNKSDKAKARMKQSVKRWKQRNPLKVQAMRNNRRCRELKAEGKISQRTIEDLYVKQRGKCACCGVLLEEKFHLDHIVPLSKGGSNFRENLQLLTPFCNQSKGAKTMKEFLKES